MLSKGMPYYCMLYYVMLCDIKSIVIMIMIMTLTMIMNYDYDQYANDYYNCDSNYLYILSYHFLNPGFKHGTWF